MIQLLNESSIQIEIPINQLKLQTKQSSLITPIDSQLTLDEQQNSSASSTTSSTTPQPAHQHQQSNIVSLNKRKGSFKKWLKSSHKKISTTNMINNSNQQLKQKSLTSLNSSNKVKKVLSNCEDIKNKAWPHQQSQLQHQQQQQQTTSQDEIIIEVRMNKQNF